jgi:hypothetical protein
LNVTVPWALHEPLVDAKGVLGVGYDTPPGNVRPLSVLLSDPAVTTTLNEPAATQWAVMT